MPSTRAAAISLVIPEESWHILQALNTNNDRWQKIAFAITAIKGVGRRYAHVVLRKADIDLTKGRQRTEDAVEHVIAIMQNPYLYKIPDWFLNRQKDVMGGKHSQVLSWSMVWITSSMNGATEENSGPQRDVPFLGTLCLGPAHQDH